MATHSAATAVHATLVATVVDTVTITSQSSELVIYNRSSLSDLYFRVDGTNPQIAGDDSHIVPINSNRRIGPPDPINIQVKLISVGTPPYSVEVA